MKNQVLSTKDLAIGYAQKNAPKVLVSNISLSFNQGSLVALIGANGIGKSTLLRTLSGILKPVTGEIFYEQKPLISFSSAELAQKMALVLTEKLPPSNLSVYELVALGRQPYNNWLGKQTPEDLAAVEQALQHSGAIDYADKKYYEISDGQLQKALIARALAQDTPMIILDEPTTHLDLSHKVGLFKLLKKLAHEQQKCILFSTHDIEMALQISDEMLVMTPNSLIQDKPANLIADGRLQDLFSDDDISFDAEKVKFIFKGI